MTTIGTITYHDSINYGAILQAYALQKQLTCMGYFSEIIDYRNPKRVLNELSVSRRASHYVWHRVIKKILVGTTRQKKTDAFRREHCMLSSRTYVDAESLHTNPPRYDAYITGSDQVWNPRNNSNDSSFFLTFAPQKSRRISYSASFGVAQIKGNFIGDYGKWLKQIDFLSVREIEGKKIVEELTGRQAEIVLDPTLLLDREDWRQIAVPCSASDPYILCYYMPGDRKVNSSITELAHQTSILTGWKIICIGQKEYMRLHPWRQSVFDAGPAEFLGLMQRASFVITNSFHGVAFSVNFRKPFLAPVNYSLQPEKALSTRITSILKTLALEHRLLPAGERLSCKTLLDIDYRTAESLLEKEKQRSIDFLKNALGGG